MDVEAVPKVAADYHASETEVLGHPYVVEIHAAQGIDVAVYQSLSRCLVELCLGEACFFVGLALAVVNIFQQYVFRFLLCFLQFVEFSTCA